ncbi:hypothetical protein PZA11_005580 [Diplocarpon coronariae]
MATPNGSRTLPRGFKYEQPKTPEPTSAAEPRQPSPPRQRFKVRRRDSSSLHASTQHFLASVAAADALVPTIEGVTGTEDWEMPDREPLSIDPSALLPPQHAAPPTTPVPMLSVELPRRPDWSMRGSPGPDGSWRSASSLSDASYDSDDSQYGGSRASRPSDDGSCTSPESDISDPFRFPSLEEKGQARLGDDPFHPPTSVGNQIPSKRRRDAPWSSDQSAHLWSTYMIYLQDPTVTPFRVGASAVPPEGVCHRVAREARRSWKGQKAATPRRLARRSSIRLASEASQDSGRATPTETARVYGAWPHASGATRSHLREMCRNPGHAPVSRYRHHQSPEPTPFSRLRPGTAEPPRPSLAPPISCKEIALSLSTSTADSMQPGGPLARLAVDGPSDLPARIPDAPRGDFKPLSFGEARGFPLARGGRLASPFVARTYGPSSSQNLEPRPSCPRSHPDPLRHRRSPLHVGAPHSLNGTQKRRAQNDLEEELRPVGEAARPSILDEQLFGTPLNQRRVRCRGFSLGDEALRFQTRGSGLFRRSPAPAAEFPGLARPEFTAAPAPPPTEPPRLLSPVTFGPPRLGSPFSESGPRHTFPRRLVPDGSSPVRRSAFATMHQTRHSMESLDFRPGPSLQGRLEKLDTKLQEIREREAAARRHPPL